MPSKLEENLFWTIGCNDKSGFFLDSIEICSLREARLFREKKFRQPNVEWSLLKGFEIDAIIKDHLASIGSMCPACRTSLKPGFLIQSGARYWLGSLVPDQDFSRGKLNKLADNFGVTKLFIEGAGLLDVSESRVRFLLEERHLGERAIFVVDGVAKDTDDYILKEDYVCFSSSNISLYMEEGSHLREIDSDLICTKCKKAYELSENDNSYFQNYLDLTGLIFDKGSLLELSLGEFLNESFLNLAMKLEKDCETLTEIGYKLRRYLRYFGLIGHGDLTFLHKISLISIEEQYFLWMVRNVLFGSLESRSQNSFPVLAEFPPGIVSQIEADVLDAFGGKEVCKEEQNSDFFVNCHLLSRLSKEELLDDSSILDPGVYFLNAFLTESEIGFLTKVKMKDNIQVLNGLWSFENKNTSARSTILTYFNLSTQFADLYASHPVSRARGYEASQFLASKSQFLCPNCRGSISYVNGEVCGICNGSRFDNILNEIRWNGISICDVMIHPIHSIATSLGKFIPKLKKLGERFKEAEIDFLPIGSQVSNLSGPDHLTLNILRYEELSLKEGSLFVLMGAGTLVKNRQSMLLSAFSRMLANGVRIVVTGYK